jgi:lipopolysaccharide/colanic/teichoic acid biosynthesis glycosyltransferase
MPGVRPERLEHMVRRYAHVFPHLIVVPNVFGLSSLGVGTRDLGGFVGLYNKQNLLLRHNRVLKRVMDLLLAIPMGLVALPAIGLAALAVFVVSPGNPFYAQRREGYRGRPVYIWKLRTMRKNADAYLERYLAEHPEARAEWESHFKLARDPRVLPGIGALLRRASLDELPQLLNILKGEMSFVGPRPFPYYHLEQFGEEFRRLRTSVLPGLTGQWQVTSRSTADLAAQEQLDSYYIRNWSLWMDVYLIARTPWAVLFGKGAY